MGDRRRLAETCRAVEHVRCEKMQGLALSQAGEREKDVRFCRAGASERPVSRSSANCKPAASAQDTVFVMAPSSQVTEGAASLRGALKFS